MQTAIAKPDQKKKRILSGLFRIFFYIGIVILIGVGGLFYYWKTHKRTIVRDSLERMVAKNSDGLYKLEMGKVDLDEVAGWMKLEGVRLNYDSLRFKLLETQDDAPPMLLGMKADLISIDGVESSGAMKNGKVRGKTMEIRNPIIDIVYTYHGKNSAKNIPTKEEIYREMIKGMDIELDSIIITGAQIRTRNFATGKSIVEISDLSIGLGDLKMNEEGLKDSSRLFFSRNFTMKGGKAKWSSLNKMYRYQVDNVAVNSTSNVLSVGEFSVHPVMGEQEFIRSSPTQVDRCDFYFRNIKVINIDFNSLLGEKLTADELVIGSANFLAYRDLNRPPDQKSKIGKYPQQLINHTPFTFIVKRVSLSNAYVEYKEKSNITFETGKIKFYRMNAVIHNFTNDTASVRRNNVMTVDLHTSFLNESEFNTHWTFYLMNPNGKFSVKGTAAGMEGSHLNVLMEPLGPARIDRGMLNGLTFDFVGNDRSMQGNVLLLYKDLKVTLLEMDKGALKPDKKFLTSFLANILIKNDNPKKRDPPRIVQVDNPRNPTESLFSFCWKSLFKGLKLSAGIKK